MKRLILTALIISASAGIVFAQVSLPGNAWQSPQSVATFGRIRSTADNFIRADYYTDVKIENSFAMMGYRAATPVNLGYGANAGGLYLGVYYGGTFWANIPTFTYTETTATWLGTANKSGVKTYTVLPDVSGTPAPNNSLSVLIGVADMGFRFSLYTNKEYFKDSDFVVGGNFYKDYETENGVITPQFVWAMAKNLTENGIRPYAGVQLAFTKNYTKVNQYSGTGGSWVANQERVTRSENNTVIGIFAGLGGLTLFTKDNFKFSADLDYSLNLTSYDNDYNYNDGSGNSKIKSGFKGTVTNNATGVSTTFVERSLTYHSITPSVSGQWSDGPISLRGKLNLTVPISETLTTENAFRAGTVNGTLVKDGTDSKATMFGFAPRIDLAAQWKVVPKMALNLGGQITFGQISSTTTESKTYNQDIVVANSSSKRVAAAVGEQTNSIAVGFTFNATDNVTLEAATGASVGGNANVTSFSQVMLSLRY